MSRPRLSMPERFWARVTRGPGCWAFAGSAERNGYLKIRRTGGASTTAHRYSYELHFGPIPAGLHVCHRCDNRACVRPDHLFVGTAGDNMADKVAKGRQAKGEAHGNSRLTAREAGAVRYLQAIGVSMADIARAFNMSHGAIYAISTSRTWSQK